MSSRLSNPSWVDPVVVSTPLVTVEREVECREHGVVARFTLTTENDRPVAVRVGQDLPAFPDAGRGFNPAHEPRAWTLEDERLAFKETVGPSRSSVLEFGVAVEEADDLPETFPDPEVERADPVGVAPGTESVVFSGEEAPTPEASTEEPRGLLSGVRSAVFGGGADERTEPVASEAVVSAADLDPDAMVVTARRSADASTDTVDDEGAGETPDAQGDADTDPAEADGGESTAVADPDAADAPGAADASRSPAATGRDTADTDGDTEPADAVDGEAVFEALLSHLDRPGARERLCESLDRSDEPRVEAELADLRREVRTLREDLEATATDAEATADRVDALQESVDQLRVAVEPPAAAPELDG